MNGSASSAQRRLTKAHAVRLIDAVDTPQLHAEVLAALAWLLEQPWPPGDGEVERAADEVVGLAAALAGWAAPKASAIVAGDPDELTDLAISLSELRTVARPG